MATAIIIIILIVVIVLAIRSYTKKLSQGCCGAGGDAVEKVKAADQDSSNYPHQYLLSIEGMTCKNCAARVENTFNKTEGFLAQVNLRKNTALVHSKEAVTDGELKSIVAKAGYHVTAIEAQ